MSWNCANSVFVQPLVKSVWGSLSARIAACAAIAKEYADAEEARTSANAARDEYAAKLATAHTTADEIIHDATVVANRRGEKIVAEAHQKADEIVRQGELEASIEKLLGREMSAADHRSMIDEFLKGVGED